MSDCELSFKMSDEEIERIKEILTKDKGLKHYLLKLSDNQKLDVVEYKEYEKLQQRIDKAIKYIKQNSKICYSNKYDDNSLKILGNFMWHTDKLLSILQDEEVE